MLKSCWQYCQQLSIRISAMKNLYQSIHLLLLFSLLMIISNKTSAEDVVVDVVILDAAPVMLEELDQIRGLGGVVDVTSHADLGAVLTNNDASHSVTGYNIIDQGSFNDASGIFSIIQNTGNNVIIQDSTIITITISPD